MKHIAIGSLYLCFLGFVGVGALLLSGHAGLAIKASNYLYFVLVIGVTIKYFDNE